MGILNKFNKQRLFCEKCNKFEGENGFKMVSVDGKLVMCDNCGEYLTTRTVLEVLCPECRKILKMIKVGKKTLWDCEGHKVFTTKEIERIYRRRE